MAAAPDSTVSPMAFQQSALRTPGSAAVAGMIFSVLMLASLVAVHFALPHVPSESGDLLTTSAKRDLLLAGLSLIPFAGVAFLWFVGVVRDRVGEREDRFFSTVFLGSGLLFVAVLLVGEAVATSMIMSLVPADTATRATAAPDWWAATRNISNELLEAALQMAGVFTTATATLLWRTHVAPRWLTLSGTVISVLLLFTLYFTQWIGLLFPAWIFVLSLYILVSARRDSVPELI
jgi:hypothetical protein